MPNSYLSYWSADRYKLLKKYGQTGQPIRVLFGGPHLSLPGFSKYNVTTGDTIYCVRVHQGIMYILGRMRVKLIQPVEEYVTKRPETFGACELSTAFRAFTAWQDEHRDQHYLCPSCCSEVAVGDEGTGIGLDIPVPDEIITALRFRSGNKERPIKHLVDGKITSVISITGHTLRLSDASAQAFDGLTRARLVERNA